MGSGEGVVWPPHPGAAPSTRPGRSSSEQPSRRSTILRRSDSEAVNSACIGLASLLTQLLGSMLVEFTRACRELGVPLEGVRVVPDRTRSPRDIGLDLENAVKSAAPLVARFGAQLALAAGDVGFIPPSENPIRYPSAHHAVITLARMVLDRRVDEDWIASVAELFADTRYLEWPIHQRLLYEKGCLDDGLRGSGHPERRVWAERPQIRDLAKHEFLTNDEAVRILRETIKTGSDSGLSSLKSKGQLNGVFDGKRSVGVTRVTLIAFLSSKGIEDADDKIDGILGKRP